MVLLRPYGPSSFVYAKGNAGEIPTLDKTYSPKLMDQKTS